MTNEEAIRWLKDIHHRFNPTGEKLENEGGDVHLQALDMAIEALSNAYQRVECVGCVDLIRRQDALKPFCIAPDGTRIPEVDCDNFPVEFSVEFIKKHLLSLPSIDAAEVVRCRDCKWYDKGENEVDAWSICIRTYGIKDDVSESDYCSWGERREDGEEE